MRSHVHAVVLPSEIGGFADEVRRVFIELGRSFGAESLAGECTPAVDVYETDERVEILVDVPGVDPRSVRIIVKGSSVLIAGEKAPRRGRRDSTFHLVERGFGRFARVVRLSAPCDTSRARATLVNGELRVTVPKIPERRGRRLVVTVESPHTPRPS